MAHALARRSRDACDVGHHRLGDKLGDVGRRSFFVAAADLADHDDAFGLRVALEQLDDIDEVHAAHRIATDAHAGALTQAVLGGLVHSLVSERARTRDDADAALLMDEARHDADLAFVGRDDARAVGSDQACARTGQRRFDADHVVDRNAFGDADHQLDARIGGLEYGVGRSDSRHIDHAGGGAGLTHGIARGVEHRQVQVGGATAARLNAADYARAVGDALL